MIYISIGTILKGAENFFRACMEAFREKNVTVVLSVGNSFNIVKLGGLPSWQWIVGVVLAFAGFAVMEQFFLRTVGLTFSDFRKMAMARVLGNRK